MRYWLMKSEPDVFGIEHLIKMPKQTEHWDGIRNYQARNFMRDEMQVGDLAFFYHSNCKVPGIVGTMKVVRAAYPDHTAFDPDSKYFDPKSKPDNPRWVMIDVQFDQAFNDVISLATLRTLPELSEMRLLQKGNRLSITPVSKQEWKTILSLV